MINIGMEMIKTYNPEFITVTESATDHLVTQIENQNGVGVSLGVKPSGCAGFEYEWKIVHEFNADEYAITKLGNYSIIVEDICKPYISGSIIDLLDEGIKGKTLVVQSPQAVSSCGCGESIQFAGI
tara:strand:+ start:9627 stop:10004 length:378 start_codon:yes stop_codon:yes gene_type:complete